MNRVVLIQRLQEYANMNPVSEFFRAHIDAQKLLASLDWRSPAEWPEIIGAHAFLAQLWWDIPYHEQMMIRYYHQIASEN